MPVIVEVDLRFLGREPTDGSDAESDSHPSNDDILNAWRAFRDVTGNHCELTLCQAIVEA